MGCYRSVGQDIQQKILRELCSLRAPAPDVPNRDRAIGALRQLKELAHDYLREADIERASRETRRGAAEAAREALVQRTKRLEELKVSFLTLMGNSSDVQRRGYLLEDFLESLFLLNDLTYRPSYKNPNEQIDGSLEFKGSYYLVEAKWRKDRPDQGDLADLKTKVDRKFVNTRGVFISIGGFDDEMVNEFTKGISANIVLVDGDDLMLILEDRMTLVDALDIKIARAAQQGKIYYKLRQYLLAVS
jgi:hypothetical protein